MAYDFNKVSKMDFSNYTGSMDIYQVRKQLAKATNERIRQLERTVSPITGESYAYGHGYDLVKDWLEDNERKWFSEGLNKKVDTEDIIAEIEVLQQFLNYKTSKVSVQKKVEKKRLETFSNLYPDISNQAKNTKEFWSFLNSQAYETLVKVISSEDLQEYFSRAVDEGYSPEEIMQKYEEYAEKIIKGESKASIKDLETMFKAKEVK